MAVKLKQKEVLALTKALRTNEVSWKAIYLFGSTAKGYATKNSDRDFCIVLDDRYKLDSKLESQIVGNLCFAGFNFDILFTTQSEFKNNKLSPILHEIRTSGIKLRV
jgi:DNA polymerase sigma